MTSTLLPQFRSHLLAWFATRLEEGRTPFRRVEERPQFLVHQGLAPDLVLWINRDSLMAGAVIFIPEKSDPAVLPHCASTAATLGLRRFATWEAQAVNLWQVAGTEISLGKSWQLPPAATLTATDFAMAGDRLLKELSLSAIDGSCPAATLPAEHFASLCLLNLELMQPALEEAARMAAHGAQNDTLPGNLADTNGWLALWRLLALLWHRRLPAGVAPEKFRQAIGYAIADLPPELAIGLAIPDDETPLPATVATRCQQLAGRLTQLDWPQERQRTLATIALLLNEAVRRQGLARVDEDEPAAELLVNRLPATTANPRALLAPRSCLAGLTLLSSLDGSALPTFTLVEELEQLPPGWRPQSVDAWLNETTPPSPAQRRRLLATLRRAWPYRRLTLPAATPAWVWQALFLSGIAAPDGELYLHLPRDWATAQGAELFWQMLGEQWALSALRLHPNGRQTLTLVAVDRAPPAVSVRSADAAAVPAELPSTDVPLARLAGLAIPAPLLATKTARRQNRESLQQQIENKVFRDGLPRFPEDYLRRREAMPLHSHRLPGPLRHDSSFFGYCRLSGPAGETIDVDSPETAEALVLAGYRGPRQVSLPSEPLATAELIRSYRSDLSTLWDNLLRECRRYLSRQQQARSMARQIWQRHRLPPIGPER